jgi:hypothetical protein
MNDAAERAMALVDGQLAPAEVPGLVQELAHNAALVAELQTYLAVSRSRIASAYAAKGEESVPPWLVNAVMRAPAPRRVEPVERGLPALLAQGQLWLQRRYRLPAWSLVAAPALATVALVAVSVVALAPGRTVLAEAGLGAALETTASGKDAALATVRPVLSFNSKSDGWCRQIEVRHANKQVSHALACRDDNGQWNMVASTPPGSGGLAPASADRRKAIDDRVTAMIKGEPLSQADEAAAIGRKWR